MQTQHVEQDVDAMALAAAKSMADLPKELGETVATVIRGRVVRGVVIGAEPAELTDVETLERYPAVRLRLWDVDRERALWTPAVRRVADTPSPEQAPLKELVDVIRRGRAVAMASADNGRYPAVTLSIDEAGLALAALDPDPTQADDPAVDRLVALITRSLAGGGCSNCGGIRHSTTCRVGRLEAAFKSAERTVEAK